MFTPKNPALKTFPLDQETAKWFGPSAAIVAEANLQLWLGNRQTPLRSLTGLARTLGLDEVLVKDESQRMGLQSFKALGGAYAVFQAVLDKASEAHQRNFDPDDFFSAEVARVAAGTTVACATDGNHGRSVAAGAKKAGCKAVIFVHKGVDEERVAAIAAFGAKIVRVDGNYDDAVVEARRCAQTNGWLTISDTSWPGYTRIPLVVMQGYIVMVREALMQMHHQPTHVFLQAGVGGFAAAVTAHLQVVLGHQRPKIVVVEPGRAACLYESNRIGALSCVRAQQPTCMAMLECYEPSLVAWQILSDLADGYVTLDEQEAIDAARRFARPDSTDPSIVSSESGAAGLAGLLQVLENEPARSSLGIDASSRILLFSTEGATAPSRYSEIIGFQASAD